MKAKSSITAYVSSRDRYFTTLPSCILSVTHQTIKPERLILFMDGEHIDLRENDLYHGLFKLLDIHGIEWEVVFSTGKGQVLNHQMAIDMCKTKWLWRLDDDTFAEPNVLEKLLECDGEKVGAIGGLVINPSGMIEQIPEGLTSTIKDTGVNTQWFIHKSQNPIEAEHLYSTFLFKKEAAKHGYCTELSPIGHHEETIFTHEMFRNGWRLIINPKAITWHIRQTQGGIRAFQKNPELWDHDDKIFQKKLKEWNVSPSTANNIKLIVLDCGMGDHVMFKMILPEVKEKYKNRKIVIGVCYPEIFENDTNIKLISIAESKEECRKINKNMDDFNIYKFCIDKKWKRSMVDAFRKMYLEVLQ